MKAVNVMDRSYEGVLLYGKQDYDALSEQREERMARNECSRPYVVRHGPQLYWMKWHELLKWVCTGGWRPALCQDRRRFSQCVLQKYFVLCTRGSCKTGRNVADTEQLLKFVKSEYLTNRYIWQYLMLLWKKNLSESWSNMKEQFIDYFWRTGWGLVVKRLIVLCKVLVVKRMAVVYGL